MLAAATVNGFQFSLLVFSLEHDSPVTEPAHGRHLGVQLLLQKQLLGTAASGPGGSSYRRDLVKVWAQCGWLGHWVFLKYMNTVFFPSLFYYFSVSFLQILRSFVKNWNPELSMSSEKWKSNTFSVWKSNSIINFHANRRLPVRFIMGKSFLVSPVGTCCTRSSGNKFGIVTGYAYTSLFCRMLNQFVNEIKCVLVHVVPGACVALAENAVGF